MSLRTSPPASSNGGNHPLGVIIEQRNDFCGFDRVGQRGIAPKIGKPQHRVDAFCRSAGNAALKHAPAGVLPEINLHEGFGDPRERYTFEPERQRRDKPPQRGTIGLAKSVGIPRRPMRINRIHFPDDRLAGKTLHEGYVVRVAPLLEFVEPEKVRGFTEADASAHFVRAGLQQVMKCGALPPLRRLALARAAVFKRRLLLHTIIPPQEDAALPDRMQGVNDRDCGGNRQARSVGAFAKAVQQFGF